MAKLKIKKIMFKQSRNSAKFLLFLLIIPGLPQNSSASFSPKYPVYHKQWKGISQPLQRRPFISPQKTAPPQGIVILQPMKNEHYHHRISQLPPKRYVPFNFKPAKKQGMISFPKCEGRKNLINDIGIVSLITAIASSTFGMYTIIFNSITSNNIGIVSGLLSLILWLPSTLITFFNLNGSFIYNLSNFLNGASFFNALFGLVGVWYGTWDVITSVLGETVGLSSLALSIIATFPDFLDELIELAYTLGNRRQLEYFVENYGCRVPGLFTVMGRHLYDILDRMLINSTKYVTAAVQKTS